MKIRKKSIQENGLIARAKDASAKYAESKQLDSFGKSMQDLSGLSGNSGSSSNTGTGNTNAPSVTFTGASSTSIPAIDCSGKSLNYNYIGMDNILCPIVAIQVSKQLSIVNE